jgi:hypothetical protein
MVRAMPGATSKSLLEQSWVRARLHPVGNGRYSVIFDGKLLVERSHDPDRDAARALLARGIAGKIAHDHRHREAAQFTVEEGPHGPLLRRYRGMENEATAPAGVDPVQIAKPPRCGRCPQSQAFFLHFMPVPLPEDLSMEGAKLAGSSFSPVREA